MKRKINLILIIAHRGLAISFESTLQMNFSTFVQSVYPQVAINTAVTREMNHFAHQHN